MMSDAYDHVINLEECLLEDTNNNNRMKNAAKKRNLLKNLEENVVGHYLRFVGPFGKRRAVYCDYTASGRPVKFIEDYITKRVHPLYANTHTTTGVMSRQTTQFRKEARDIIKKCVNASSKDVLIFTGSGTTGAVNKLVHILQLHGPRAKQTVIFVGPFEHHSNILPWKETAATVVRIKLCKSNGLVDYEHLEEQLKHFMKKKTLKIGCFTAAANVTGIVTDTNRVTALLHRYGALAFWDYATAGPYMPIDMNPSAVCSDGSNCVKDAVYLSPHKFVGGVGTPGVLIAKKTLFTNPVPAESGGGTVLFVTRNKHFYLKNIEEREEGGTPAIVESIRAGLAFKLKQAIGADTIMGKERELTRVAFEKWKRNPNIIILGNTDAERLSIFSFVVVHPESGKLLHHNFLAVLLNDMYGIQARGGCACAGPYAQDLLGISEELAEKFIYFLLDEDSMKDKVSHRNKKYIKKKSLEIMKPGFLRLNLPYFFPDYLTAFIILAVDQLANHGWKLLPQYKPDLTTGNWTSLRKSTNLGDSLHNINFDNGVFSSSPSPYSTNSNLIEDKATLENELLGTIKDAEAIYCKAGQMINLPRRSSRDKMGDHVGDLDETLIWFLRPSDVLKILRVKAVHP